MIEKIDAIHSLVGGAITQKYGGDVIYHDGQVAPSEEQIQAKIAELTAAESMRLLREQRNQLLSATDWWVLPDRTATQGQLDYRQALRDLPANSPNAALDEQGNLINVTWPTKPEA